MTLPASGVITMGDVNTELGYSATAAISLNDTAVRTLFGIASGAISLNDGYGKSNYKGSVAYLNWSGSLNNTPAAFKWGTLIGVHDVKTPSTGITQLTFLNSSITISSQYQVRWHSAYLWTTQRCGVPPGVNTAATRMAHAAWNGWYAGSGNAYGAVSCNDETLTTLWSHIIVNDTADGQPVTVSTPVFDSSNNVLFSGTQYNWGPSSTFLGAYTYCGKFDATTGSVIWSYRTQSGQQFSSGNAYGPTNFIDASDNIYMVGYSGVLVMSSTGTVTLCRSISGSIGTGVNVDASGNIYVIGVSSSSDGGTLYKLNSSGTFQWGRKIANTAGVYGDSGAGRGILLASDGYLYVTIDNGVPTGVASSHRWTIMKYNTSGELQWQRMFRSSEADYASANYSQDILQGSNVGKLQEDSSGRLFFAFHEYSKWYGSRLGVIYIPKNGACIGTASMVCSDAGVTLPIYITAGTLTDTAYTYTSTATSITLTSNGWATSSLGSSGVNEFTTITTKQVYLGNIV